MTVFANGMFWIDDLTDDFWLREAGAWVLKGNIGPNGSVGHGAPTGAQLSGLYIDIDAGNFYENGAVLGTITGSGAAGPRGQAAPFIPGQDGTDGEDSFVPGPPGPPGIQGTSGSNASSFIMRMEGTDGADGADSFVPGPPGVGTQGNQGIQGPPGIDGNDGADGADSIVPGPPGVGTQGIQGSPGSNASSFIMLMEGNDGADGADSFVPGPQGPPGTTAAAVISANVLSGSAVTLTSGVAANVATITLTPGTWDVDANTGFLGVTSTSTVAQWVSNISETSATLDFTTADRAQLQNPPGDVLAATGATALSPTGVVRFTVAPGNTKQLWHVARATWTGGGIAAFGLITARQIGGPVGAQGAPGSNAQPFIMIMEGNDGADGADSFVPGPTGPAYGLNQSVSLTGTGTARMPASVINVTDNVAMTFSTTDAAGNYTPEGWDNIAAFEANWTGAGSLSTGGRTALLGNAFLTSPSNVANTSSDFYAGAVLTSNIYCNDNGTIGTPLGSAFGLATVTYLKSTVTHWGDAFGAEFDVVCEAGSGVVNKVGVLVSQFAGDAVQGTGWDAAYLMQGMGPGWRYGYCAASDGVHNPFSSDGSLLCTYGAVTMANVVDVSSATVTGYLFKSGPFKVTANGAMILSANASATLPAAFSGDSVSRFAGADATRTRSVIDSFGTGVATAFSTSNLRRANGTGAAPTAVQSGDLLFGYLGAGYGTTGYNNSAGAGILGWASQTFTDTVAGTELSFVFTPNGVTTNVEAGRILNSGTLSWTFSSVFLSGTAIPAGGTTGAGIKVSSTANFGMFFGSGAPTLAAAQGSLYLRSDGSGPSTRMYVNTDGSTGWKNVTTPGTATNDNASSGDVGEYIESTLASASAVSVTNATGKTIVSIALTAGDWDVDAILGNIPANTTNVTQFAACLSLVNNTIDTTVGRIVAPPLSSLVGNGSNGYHCAIPPYRFSLSAPTTIYLVAFDQFTVSTCVAFGIIRARRVR